MDYQDIIVEVVDRVGWITINRPTKLNSLSPVTFREMATALDELENNSEARVVVITGAGEKAFSTGVDIASGGPVVSSEDFDNVTKLNAGVIEKIWYLDKPVISAVNGYALAAGCNLALVPDLTIAAETAYLGEPEIRHGSLSPLLLLPWMMHMKIMHEHYYTGDMVSAAEAKEQGLVNRVVPLADLRSETQKYARRIANASAYTLKMAKRSIRMTYDIMGFKGAQSAHRYLDTYLLDSHGDKERDNLKEVRLKEGMKAFLEKRDGPYK